MRARVPDIAGSVDRDGVAIHYEVYGEGTPTLLLIPSAPITHSRIWKGHIPSFARSHRVVTFDGRGNGASGRPTEPAAHGNEVVLADIDAVLEATATGDVIVIGHCHANWWAVETAVAHPDRVRGPSGHRARASPTWAGRSPTGSRPAPTGTRCSTTRPAGS